MLPVSDIRSRILLNSKREGIFDAFFIQLYGKGLVIAFPYLLFSSIFCIFVDIFFGSQGYRSTNFYPCHFLVKVFESQSLGVY